MHLFDFNSNNLITGHSLQYCTLCFVKRGSTTVISYFRFEIGAFKTYVKSRKVQQKEKRLTLMWNM